MLENVMLCSRLLGANYYNICVKCFFHVGRKIFSHHTAPGPAQFHIFYFPHTGNNDNLARASLCSSTLCDKISIISLPWC